MKDFPLKTTDLLDYLPHRPPMVWIDEVTWVNSTEGECHVHLRAEGLYQGPQGIRPSSMIEWIAQGYAFVRAAQTIQGMITLASQPKRAFLVAIRDAQFPLLNHPGILIGVKSLKVKIRHERDLGPLSLIEGSVFTPEDKLLATAKLKLFAE